VAVSLTLAGGPIAAALGPILGGLAAHQWGWRAGFLMAGLPGLLVVILIRATLKDPRTATREAATGPRGDLRWFRRSKAFWLIVASAAFNGMPTTGIGAFLVSFIVRRYGFDLRHAGALVGTLGFFALGGVLAGGFLADRFSRSSGRSYLYVPAVGAAIAGTALMTAFATHSWPLAFAALAVGQLVWQMGNAPTMAAVQNIAPPELRATASALFMFGATAIGTGFGPLLVGLISDRAGAAAYGGPAFSSACRTGHAAHGALPSLTPACATASADGLQTALFWVAGLYLIAVVLAFLAARRLPPLAAQEG
jgi:predicted MFS family arabinose efflux permease